MKALVFHGKNDLRLEDIPEPQCGAGQVKVKPVWCGICGTGMLYVFDYASYFFLFYQINRASLLQM